MNAVVQRGVKVIGLLMLIVPIAVYVVSIPLSKRLTSALRKFYLVVGGIVVFIGGGIALYFALYSGDQGGIAAYFFQLGVILVYVLLLSTILALSLVTKIRQKRMNI